ncbi:MAG: glycoside hydrolase family 130 protein [Melioribacteraceae bacterium]|nr:glycoside hydrolase family 130 protein [Melioribacteraceae bacterium]
MNIKRTDTILKPDIKRVILRPFGPLSDSRNKRIINSVLSLSEAEIEKELERVFIEFGNRHRNLKEYLLERFAEVETHVAQNKSLNINCKLLIGSYFTMEYSIEAAALFNPSMVKHPDQSGMPEGSERFVLSLRATGEGHISSITFRTCVIDENTNIKLEEHSNFVTSPNVKTLLNSSYECSFSSDMDISERLLFPYSPDESNGIEDARFVTFTDENGDVTYYATYTAYDGKNISPKLLETTDFLNFKISTLSGKEVFNKGMALFPKKINGKYVMLGRQDAESNYIMFSDSLYHWNSKEIIQEPAYTWELLQIGNCGSPIETEKGWLVLTHGVGPIRKYSIGVFLLDLNDPSKVIGRLDKPILSPDETERAGYVPNVVYSCGGALHNNNVIIPYAMSDYASSFAIVNVNDILNELVQ